MIKRFPWLGARRPHPPMCYLRENGPICYETERTADGSRLPTEAMLGDGLVWVWKGDAPAGSGLAARAWTQLTPWSLAALRTDREARVGQTARRVLALGIVGEDTPNDMSDATATSWMTAFAADRAGPLQVVLNSADPRVDRVFVAQHPPDPVRLLLQAWSIDRDRAERRAYARLKDASLEALIRGLAADR